MKTFRVATTLAFVAFVAFQGAANALLDPDDDGTPKLQIVSPDITTKLGAYCLDGTPAAFYFAPAREESKKNDWVLYFKGGGACTSVSSCESRAKSTSGSSKGLAATYSRSGPMSSSTSSNPTFANANRVILWYCDGMFFAGDKTDQEKGMYFRGYRVLQAILDELTAYYGFNEAENVLLTGCSSGGYSAYLHTDYVGDYLHRTSKNLKRYKSMPLSGLFVNGSNYKNQYTFGLLQALNFALHNATAGVNANCVKSEGPNGALRCSAPEMDYAYSKYPVFLANSLLDYGTLLASFLNPPAPNVSTKCLKKVEAECDGRTIQELNTVQDKMTKLITNVKAIGAKEPAMEKPGNGAFLIHCVSHCLVESSWTKLKLGNTTLIEAFTKWWEAPNTAPAKAHTYIETCKMSLKKPYECNPTCGTQ